MFSPCRVFASGNTHEIDLNFSQGWILSLSFSWFTVAQQTHFSFWGGSVVGGVGWDFFSFSLQNIQTQRQAKFTFWNPFWKINWTPIASSGREKQPWEWGRASQLRPKGTFIDRTRLGSALAHYLIVVAAFFSFSSVNIPDDAILPPWVHIYLFRLF